MRKLLLVVVLALVLAGCAGEEEHTHEETNPKHEEAEGYLQEGPFEGEPYVEMKNDEDFDASEDYVLCSASQHVFFGEVIGKRGTENMPTEPDPTTGEVGVPLPYTQFEVRVRKDQDPSWEVKNSLEEESVVREMEGDAIVVVNQGGGQVDTEMHVEVFENDMPLTEGKGYLFFTVYDPEKKRYDIVAQPEGNVEYPSGPERDERLAYLKKEVCPTFTVPVVEVTSEEPLGEPEGDNSTAVPEESS